MLKVVPLFRSLLKTLPGRDFTQKQQEALC
jgi:hypothetical protein